MKRSMIFWGIGVLVVLAIIVGVVVLTGKNPATSQQTTTQASQNSPAGQTVTITYTDSGFSPDTYTIKAGGTVTVVNNASGDLQFSSGPHPTHTAEPELNMGVLHKGQSGSFKVTKVGTWSFHNHFNEQDTGSLVVE